MNLRQRKILIFCAVIIGLMMLFPPFATYLPNGGRSNEGFSFFLWTPKGSWDYLPSINALQLLAQWIAVCLIGGIAYLLANGEQSRDSSGTQVGLSSASSRVWMAKLCVTVLRWVRGIGAAFALVGSLVLIGDLVWLIGPHGAGIEAEGKVIGLAFAKFIGLVFIFFIFKFLRSVINIIHVRYAGGESPILPNPRSL